jgi:proton-coupled amino acid transporter
MSSPLPVNAKQGYREGGSPSSHLQDTSYLSSSAERASSTARLGSSPAVAALYGSSPKSVLSHHTYGSTDLDNVLTTNSGSLFRPLSTATFNPEDNTVSVDLPDDQVANIVKRHLVDTSPSASLRSRSILDDAGSSNVKSVHQLPGGAITHDIYKWADGIENEQLAKRQRSQSVFVPRKGPLDPALARLKDPGGFRRHFVVDKAARQGRQPPNWMTRTFVDFLALYGHFGGEDLSDDEDEEDNDLVEDDTEAGGLRRRRRSSSSEDEELPLIRRAQANAVQGTATPAKAVFLLLKSFVGTGVMFLPKALVIRH